MSRTALFLCLVFATAACALDQKPPAPPASAQDVVRTSLAAMGGEDAIRGIRTLQFKATMQRNALEQSERPEGPYIAEYRHVNEWRDVAGHRWKQTYDSEFAFYKFSSGAIVSGGGVARVAGNRVLPGGAADLEEAEDVFDLAPERVLLTALAAPDLHRLPDTMLQSLSQQVVGFQWQHRPGKLFFNPDTHLLTAVEWTRAYPGNTYWNPWGDVTTRVYYSLWWLAPGDIRYPLQLDYVRNGLEEHKITITELEINKPIADDVFAIPAEVKAAAQSHPPVLVDDRPLPAAGAQQVADGIVFIPGAWNVTLVKQADGIVIVEAPISSGYSAKVIAEAQKRFPGLPIKAAISTSDSWPHIGGVREYVARGVPVYVLDRTLPLLRRLAAAPHREHPDALARGPHPAKFVSVSQKTLLGAGPNRIEIYPIHGDTAERQMMVYFPEHKLLYGSDPFQQADNAFTDPEAVSELRNAVAREHLDVETFFMMHIGPTAWKEVLAAHGHAIPQS